MAVFIAAAPQSQSIFSSALVPGTVSEIFDPVIRLASLTAGFSIVFTFSWLLASSLVNNIELVVGCRNLNSACCFFLLILLHGLFSFLTVVEQVNELSPGFYDILARSFRLFCEITGAIGILLVFIGPVAMIFEYFLGRTGEWKSRRRRFFEQDAFVDLVLPLLLVLLVSAGLAWFGNSSFLSLDHYALFQQSISLLPPILHFLAKLLGFLCSLYLVPRGTRVAAQLCCFLIDGPSWQEAGGALEDLVENFSLQEGIYFNVSLWYLHTAACLFAWYHNVTKDLQMPFWRAGLQVTFGWFLIGASMAAVTATCSAACYLRDAYHFRGLEVLDDPEMGNSQSSFDEKSLTTGEEPLAGRKAVTMCGITPVPERRPIAEAEE